MRIAHFDVGIGASGDMILGALVDAGLSFEELRAGLAELGVSGYELTLEQVKKQGIAASKVTVTLTDEQQPHRHLRHIVEILDASRLSPEVVAQAKAVFQRLAEAEAKVHATTVERIHFHEVGAVDAIVDVVGAVWGLRRLGVERVTCSPLPVSHGWVQCAHGRMPVPAPATQELLVGCPTRPVDVEGETLTPTGAALLTTLADAFESPAMTPERVGYGAGSKDFPLPNVLRLVLGQGQEAPATVTVIEANLDDMNPEWYEPAMQRLFAAGALDVALSPLQMKKNRPGVLLRVICPPAARAAVSEVVFRETTTFGLRWYVAQRECLAREAREVATTFGPVRVKIGWRNGELMAIAPEHDACQAVAAEAGASLPAVYAAAREAARRALAAEDNGEVGSAVAATASVALTGTGKD